MGDTDHAACPRCGKPQPIEAPAGLCPRCRLEGSRDSGVEVTDSLDSAQLGRLLESLAASIGPVPRILLPDTGDVATEPPLVNPSSPEMPLPADRPVRVQLLGEIARGGMGVVLKGRDPDLGRDLAVKVLLEAHKDKPELVRRFIEEAQIGGQLQHPGVVPVYELGTFGDLRPYFTMKLVKGQTLAELLAGRELPAADLPRFLGIFEQVGQTMAYAHARDVIHRDLKPSNVMVGSFGEVQVMDWGLAKVIPRGGVVDDASAGKVAVQLTVIATARVGSDSDLSQAGSVLGTPAYMAPEQARGETDLIDERADVFALGSILCEVLTGQPAFVGRSPGELHRKAALGDLAEAVARLEGSGADGELVALAKDCLAREPEDRPRHAGAVTDRITAYLAGVQEKLRAAELARAAESARAEEARRTAQAAEARAAAERRARRLTAALAATVLLAAGLGIAGWRWVEQERLDRAQELAGRVNAALQQATRLRGQAQGAPAGDLAPWIEAVAVAKKASELLEPGVDPALRRQVEELLAEVMARERQAQDAVQAAVRDRRLLDFLVDIRTGESVSEAMYAAAFREAGFDADVLGPEAAAAKIKARPAGVILAVAAGLDGWATQRRGERPSDTDAWMRLVATARAADPDPRRDQLRQIWSEPDRKSQREPLRKLAQEADPRSWPVQSLVRLAIVLNEADERDAAVALLRRAQGEHPGDFQINYYLAGYLEQLRPPPTEEVIRFYSVARALRPETAHELAHALADRGRGDEAVLVFEDLTRRRPQHAGNWHCLALLLQERGDRVKAAPALERAAAIDRETIRLNPDYTWAHAQLGQILRAQGKQNEAIAEYRTAIRLNPEGAWAHRGLGIILCDDIQDYEAAAAEFRTSIRLVPDDAKGHNNLGIALRKQGHLEEAIAEHRTAIRLQPDFAHVHASLAWTLRLRGHLEEAIAEFRTAIRLKPDAAEYHNDLGVALQLRGKMEEAIAEHRTALRLRLDYDAAHNSLAWTLAIRPDPGRREHAEALEHARKAVALNPKDGNFYNTLALAEYRAGHWAESRTASEQSIKMTKGVDASNWFFLAMASWQQGEKNQARTWFDKAVAWTKEKDPRNTELRQFWNEAAELLGRPGPDAPGPGSTAAPPAPKPH